MSSASVLIKLSEAHPLVIGAYRLGIASLILLAASTPTLGSVSAEVRRQVKVLFFSGVSLALHFATWITSLKYTSVAISVVLTDSAPIFSVLFAWVILGELPTSKEILGVVLGMMGALVIGCRSLSMSHFDFTGAVLALAGAVFLSAYLVAGRSARRSLPVIPYAALVYGISAVILAVAALAAGQRLLGYPTREYLIFAALALGPSCVAHTSYNYSLKYLKAHAVALAILGEPVGATLLAWIFLGEVPALEVAIGGALVLIGSALAASAEVG